MPSEPGGEDHNSGILDWPSQMYLHDWSGKDHITRRAVTDWAAYIQGCVSMYPHSYAQLIHAWSAYGLVTPRSSWSPKFRMRVCIPVPRAPGMCDCTCTREWDTWFVQCHTVPASSHGSCCKCGEKEWKTFSFHFFSRLLWQALELRKLNLYLPFPRFLKFMISSISNFCPISDMAAL